MLSEILVVGSPLVCYVQGKLKPDHRRIFSISAGILFWILEVGFRPLLSSFLYVAINFCFSRLLPTHSAGIAGLVFAMVYLATIRAFWKDSLAVFLVLRAAAYVFDFCDSKENFQKLQNENSNEATDSVDKHAFHKTWSIWNYMSYCYFYTGMCTSPFVTHKGVIASLEMPRSSISKIPFARHRLLKTLHYFVAFIILNLIGIQGIVSDPEILTTSLMWRYICLFGGVFLYRSRLILGFCLGEIGAAFVGLGETEFFEEKPAQSEQDHFDLKIQENSKSWFKKVCRDCRINHSVIEAYDLRFEISPTFSLLVRRWNMSCQKFMALYVSKRVPRSFPKFWRNILTLFFSFLWHGSSYGMILTIFLFPFAMFAQRHKWMHERRKKPFYEVTYDWICSQLILFFVISSFCHRDVETGFWTSFSIIPMNVTVLLAIAAVNEIRFSQIKKISNKNL
eukprot:GHVP01009749.1.p1 GENE.GHVP01009749.1~~GHVP01009749.1.p1  ORF type:complete len:451 (-),score=51.59 GHVP01009749.1:59-1411(-)